MTRLIHILFCLLCVVSVFAQPPRTLKLTQLELGPDFESGRQGFVGVTDSSGHQRYEFYVEANVTCITFTPTALDNDPFYFSKFVKSCDSDSSWYIDWTGRSFLLYSPVSGGTGGIYGGNGTVPSGTRATLTDDFGFVVGPTDVFLVANDVGESALSIDYNTTLIGGYDEDGEIACSLQFAGPGATLTGGPVDYAADYSGSYTDRSMVDKEYVDNAVSGGSPGVGGIYGGSGTVTGGTVATVATDFSMDTGAASSVEIGDISDVGLGGVLSVTPGYIRAGDAGYYFETNLEDQAVNMNAPSGGLSVFGNGALFSITSTASAGWKIKDFRTTKSGFQYDADYSAGFDNRSLVDKEYVDNAVAGGGSGTVTSVGVSAPSGVFDVSGSPVTSAGTIAITFDNQTANTGFYGPDTGSPGAPAFRAMVAADISASIIDSSKVVNGGLSLDDIGQRGASTGQVPTWNGSAWRPATPASFPAGTDQQTIRYNGTTPTANSILRNDGTGIGINAAPVGSYDLVTSLAARFGGVGEFRGSGNPNAGLTSAAISIYNTTLGDGARLGLTNAGRFRVYTLGSANPCMEINQDFRTIFNADGTSVLGDTSASFQIESSLGFFLPPRMGTTTRDAVALPANGSILYNSTTGKMNFREAGAWSEIPALGSAFVNGGNSFGGTTTLGTNDANNLNFEVNNTTVATATSTGLSVGPSSPVTISNSAMTGAGAYTFGAGSNLTTLGGSTGNVVSTSSNGNVGMTYTGSSTNLVYLTNSSPSGSVRIGNTAYTSVGMTKAEVSAANSYTVGSGAGTYTFLQLNNTFATSGSTGIQRDIWINPTITSVGTGSYRALEIGVNNGNVWALYQSGANTPSTFLGKVIFGSTSTPSAKIQIAAGSATATTAPLKFTSGPVMTTPEAGAVEFDGTNFFGTASTTRYTFAKTLTATATLDFPSTGSNAVSDLTITVTGAATGDAVSIGVPNGSVTGTTQYSGWVSAANTVTVRFMNVGGSAADPSSGTFRASVIKY